MLDEHVAGRGNRGKTFPKTYTLKSAFHIWMDIRSCSGAHGVQGLQNERSSDAEQGEKRWEGCNRFGGR